MEIYFTQYELIVCIVGSHFVCFNNVSIPGLVTPPLSSLIRFSQGYGGYQQGTLYADDEEAFNNTSVFIFYSSAGYLYRTGLKWCFESEGL